MDVSRKTTVHRIKRYILVWIIWAFSIYFTWQSLHWSIKWRFIWTCKSFHFCLPADVMGVEIPLKHSLLLMYFTLPCSVLPYYFRRLFFSSLKTFNLSRGKTSIKRTVVHLTNRCNFKVTCGRHD
jgi:hypothetical protein